MNLLLDTHVLLWWLADIELRPETGELIADPDNLVAVSAASVWEVSIKRALGKVHAPPGLDNAIEASGFEPLDITAAHAERAGSLPPHHRDPFDRMLVAQAQEEDLAVITRDVAFDAYDVRIVRG